MHSKWLSFSGAVLFGAICVGFTLDVTNPLLKSHVDTLQKAPELSVTFTVNQLGSELEDRKLVVSKPNLVRLETPSTITIANGTSILQFNRKAGTYTEEPQTKEKLLAIFKNDSIWAWSALIDDNFMKPVTDAKTGAARKIKNIPIKELTVARDKDVVTLFVDDQLGIARGATYTADKNNEKVTIIVTASEIEIGKATLDPTNSSFILPTSAKKVEKTETALTFADIKPIFQANCRCHLAGARGGLSLADYASLMRGGNSGPAVVPGSPDQSLLILSIKGQKPPKMPPQGSVPSDQIDQLSKWIADGAKE